MKKEIDMLQDIEGNKCTLRYCIKEEEESGQDLDMFMMGFNNISKYVQ